MGTLTVFDIICFSVWVSCAEIPTVPSISPDGQHIPKPISTGVENAVPFDRNVKGLKISIN